MRYLQVTILAIVICLCLKDKTEVKAMKFANNIELRFAVWHYCCGHAPGKRGLKDIFPVKTTSDAKTFLNRNRRGTLEEECCEEGCDNEELGEGSSTKSEELREECLKEGCSREELEEHC